LDYADHHAGNLAEVRTWMEDDPEAHDWSLYVRRTLELELNRAVTTVEISGRERELRSKFGDCLPADIRLEEPLGEKGSYDLVISLFCIECVSEDFSDWMNYFGKLSGLVAPGGRLLIAGLKECNGYQVLGESYPATHLTEASYSDALTVSGFEPSRTVVRSYAVRDWVDEGFDGITMVCADKA
jgi:SAM-dependent methyltransferase